MKKIFYFCLTFIFGGFVYAGSMDRPVENILDQYFVIQSTLAKDSTKGVDNAAQEMVKLSSAARASDPQLQKLLIEVNTAAKHIQQKDLKQTREQFFELSKPLLAYLHQYYSGKRQFYRYFCSMAKKGWIQPQKPVRNPYLGSSMLTCGTLIS